MEEVRADCRSSGGGKMHIDIAILVDVVLVDG